MIAASALHPDANAANTATHNILVADAIALAVAVRLALMFASFRPSDRLPPTLVRGQGVPRNHGSLYLLSFTIM